jgi:hypothetical protein
MLSSCKVLVHLHHNCDLVLLGAGPKQSSLGSHVSFCISSKLFAQDIVRNHAGWNG